MKQPRFLILQALLLLFAAATVGRLFYWQVLQHEDFSVAAKDQTENTVYLSAKRGKILSSDGSTLVSNQNAYLIYAILPEIKKSKKPGQSLEEFAKEIAEKITPILTQAKVSFIENPKEKDREKIGNEIESYVSSQLEIENLIWVPLAKKVSEGTKNKLQSLNIQGIGFQEDTMRFYPEDSLAANLVGFVAKDEIGNDKGYFGLEGFYDDKLRGRSGQLIQEVDALGRPILISSPLGRSALDGATLLTTIDRTAQYIIENKLREGVKRYGAKSGAAILLDVKTSGVLATVSFPSFHPSYTAFFDADNFRNLGISEVYEPGSTFKSITMASALDAGSIDTTTKCPCKGPIRVSGYEIQTVDNKYHPNSSITQILQHSDNTGAAFAARKMGIDTFLSYIRNFGFGQDLGIDLQGEESGIVKERKDWGEVELVTGAFGQGISVTALQMVNAVAAIANDGILMKPFIVKKITGLKSEVEFAPKKIRQVIKPEASSLMRELLLSAVEGGEAKRLIPHGYRIGGKTGTAQVPLAGHYSAKTVASFVGFGPTEAPKFAMIVVLFEPSASIYAAETSEPLFFEIVKDLYPYWGIKVSK